MKQIGDLFLRFVNWEHAILILIPIVLIGTIFFEINDDSDGGLALPGHKDLK